MKSDKPISRSYSRNRLPGISGIVCVSVSLLLVHATPAPAAQRQALRGHVPPTVAPLAPTGSLSGSQSLNLAIGLPLRNHAALTSFIDQLYNPASPNFHRYLTPEQFTEKFGPTEQDYQALVNFAKANNLTVTCQHANRLLLDVNASVSEIERAFHLKLRVYPHPKEARDFYAPDVEPSLDLAVPVLFIGGLDNYALPQPMSLSVSTSSRNAEPDAGSAPDGNYMGTDFRNAYVPGSVLTGAGQTVGLLEFDGFYQSDITAYENLAGLPDVPLQTVLLGGFDGNPATSQGNLEVSLDIELVISMAPGISKIILYETSPGGLAEDILSRMANDNLAKQLSSSWNWAAYDPNSEAVFLQFASQGQTYFNATGDIDAFVGPITRVPSDDAYVVQVGGTALTMSGSGAAYASETVWNRGNGVGSSGGISIFYPIPAWQQGLDMSANMGSTTNRNVPDVAMVADGVYVKYGNGSSGHTGGTSCAAPLWAAFTALINQQALANGLPTVGLLNPAIYHVGTNADYTSCFHDITIGDNTWSNSPNRFYAVPGYDLCTGWGTPAGSNLINAIAGPPLTGPFMVPDGFKLVLETCPNGSLDPGEMVHVSFGLKNFGVANTTNLVATLQNSAGVIPFSGPADYGALTVGGAAVARLFAFTTVGTCGGSNAATLDLEDGTSHLGTVTFPFMLGTPGGPAFFSQAFDGVTAPTIPAGWTVSWSGAGAAWSTTSSQSDTAPNSAFAPDPPGVSDNSLTTPPFAIAPGSSAQLTFRHNYYTEAHYDGGALEVSIGGGAFADILDAGGSFLTNGYTQTISTCCGNPLANRKAWTGSSGGWITTIVNLPAAATGQTIQLRWRFGSDASVGAMGWYVDTISLCQTYTCCTTNYPLILSIRQSNNGTTIAWSSVSNQVYRLQSQTNLAGTNWMDVAGDVLATGPTASKTNVTDASAQKFYRVMLVP